MCVSVCSLEFVIDRAFKRLFVFESSLSSKYVTGEYQQQQSTILALRNKPTPPVTNYSTLHPSHAMRIPTGICPAG